MTLIRVVESLLPPVEVDQTLKPFSLQEEHAAAERLRAEAERLERAAALARKLEEARAKKQAEEAALQRKELAAQQMVLAKLHCKRQLMLRLGWRPWRELVDVARYENDSVGKRVQTTYFHANFQAHTGVQTRPKAFIRARCVSWSG